MNIVIIGNHAAGLSAVETLRKGDPSCSITVISNENVPPYSRCLIPYLVSGEKQVNDILFRTAKFYADNSVTTKFGVDAVGILTSEKQVLLSNGQRVGYDALIIACGGTPQFPSIPGVKTKGVFGFRTLADAEAIGSYARDIETAAVLGGGLVGLKAAAALHDAGKKVKIIVGSPHILSQIAADAEAILLEEYLTELGMEILAKTNPTRIYGQERVEGIETTEGKKIPCQMVIVGKGVSPNKDIVKDTEIKTEYGILVDDQCRTNVPDVYAAGDVAQSLDTVRNEKSINALWPLAVEEGRVAAENILGKNTSLKYRTSMNSLKIGDFCIISCGLTGARESVAGSEEITLKGPGTRESKRFILKDNRIVGYALVGNVSYAGILTAFVTKGIDISEIKDRILSGKFDFASVAPLIRKNEAKFREPEYQEVLEFV